MIDKRLLYELSVSDVTVLSGIRPSGRSSDHSYGRKKHGLLFIFWGEASFYCEDGKSLVTGDKELIYIPKGLRYRMKYSAPSTKYVLINFDTVDIGESEHGYFDRITVLGKDDELNRIAKVMLSFELCEANMTVAASLRKKELFYRLLGCVCSLDDTPFEKLDVDSKISDGVQLLKLTYLENLPITKFSDACHLNVNTFRNLFNKQFGMSPVKYRNKLRLERARELLQEGGFTIAEVAYASGFENVGYFCRYYRSIYNETPSQTKARES